MANREPIIQALPTEDHFKCLVDQIVTEENAKALARLILVPANLEDPHQADLAIAAAKHAFLVTPEFQTAFREWIAQGDDAERTESYRIPSIPELSMMEL